MFKLKLLLGALTGVAAAYLFGAFVAWDFDAGNWDAFGRAILGVCVMPVTAILGAAMAGEEGR